MNRKSLSFRIPERTPTTRKRNTELDILSYGKKYLKWSTKIFKNFRKSYEISRNFMNLMDYFSDPTEEQYVTMWVCRGHFWRGIDLSRVDFICDQNIETKAWNSPTKNFVHHCFSFAHDQYSRFWWKFTRSGEDNFELKFSNR